MLWKWGALIGSFLFCMLLFFIISNYMLQRKKQLDKRITRMLATNLQQLQQQSPLANIIENEFEEETLGNQKQAKQGVRSFHLPRIILQLTAKQFKGKSFLSGMEKGLEQAGIPFTPEEYFSIRLFIGIALAVIAFFITTGQYPLVLVIAFLTGYLLPERYVKRKRERRLQQFSIQLPAALGTMANSMRAGFSFMQSLKMVGQEMPDPVAKEFNKTLRELNLNVTVEDAFRHLLDRLPNRDLELVVSALLIQRTTGGNLAELLESMQETLHERVRIKEEMQTLTAQGRLSAWIITLLPVILVLLIHTMNPDYFTPMLHHPVGWLLIGLAVISGGLGWLAIRKIVQIEV